LIYLVSPSIIAYKIAFTIFDILTIIPIAFILKKFKSDMGYLIIYAWHPLLALEFGSSGHNDSLSIFLIMLSICFIVYGKKYSSCVALSFGVISKLYPLLISPIFFKKWGIKGTSAFFLIIFLFYIPFLNIGLQVIDVVAVFVFSARSLFNSSIFSGLSISLEYLGLDNSFEIARILAYSIFIVFSFILIYKSWIKDITNVNVIRYSSLIITTYLILSSTVHPWYILWVLPFLTFLSSRSWMLFSGSIFLTYLTYAQVPIQPGYWGEIWWIKILEYVPFFTLLIFEVVNKRYLKPIIHD
jgi:hypothetical protein